MEKRYYTPAEGELYVGYECEFRNAAAAQELWGKVNLDRKFLDIALRVKPEGIRTKYLDQSDIESLGWKPDGYDVDGDLKFYKFFGPVSYYLHFDHDETILVTKYEDRVSKGTLYNGQCKSINELKKLESWLGLK